MRPVVVLGVVVGQHAHGPLADAAYFVDCWVVEPHVSFRDAPGGTGSVKYDGLESIDRHAAVGPMRVLHEVLGQVAVLAAEAGVEGGVGEVGEVDVRLQEACALVED